MDNNPSSPLDTLRQLKEMLDAGALTPAEFEALKQRLVLNPGTPLPPPAAAPLAVLPPAPVVEQHSPMFEDVADEPPVAPTASSFPTTEPQRPETAAPNPVVQPKWTGDEFPAIAEEGPARNPLALVLSIGGVLVFLAVLAYLTLNRPPSEHISSTSQTAADSLSTTIDTGPQAAPLPATAAVPETIRVAPAHPAPVIPARPNRVATDSVAAPRSTAADSAI